MTLGLKPLQILRLVILPQALRLIVQPMSGVYVMLIKSTAILSVVGITELTRQGEVFIITFPAKSLFIYAMIAAIYFLYCYPLLRQLAGKAAGRRPARRQPQLERTPPSTMPTEYVDTYYKRTLSDPQTRYPALAGPESAEVCVVGGPGRPVGRAGTGPARPAGHAAGRQPHRLGASGRNGGSVSPAFSAGADAIRRHVDEDHYRALYRLSMEAWRSSAPTSATWTSATPTRSTAACAWCATTPATRCSAGAMNSSGFSSATCACCRAPSCASGW